MLIIIISRSSLKLGHVGSKTRSLGQQATQVSDLGPQWPSCLCVFPHCVFRLFAWRFTSGVLTPQKGSNQPQYPGQHTLLTKHYSSLPHGLLNKKNIQIGSMNEMAS